MLQPLLVWKVELARGLAHEDVAGVLTLGEGALVFEADDAMAPASIAYGAIRRVKPLRLSAVLLIRWVDDGVDRMTAFYLTQPPPLAPPEPAVPTPTVRRGFLRPTKRGQRRRNTAYLAYTGADLKPELKAWGAEVQQRAREARRG